MRRERRGRPRRRPTRWRPRKDDRGSSLVEFALVLPVFALLLFGLIDFGMVFGGYVTLQNRVNGAARAVAVDKVLLPTSPSWPSGCSSQTPALCTAEADIEGSMLGVVPGSVQVAIAFPDGESQSDDAIVCAQAELKSTTGLTSPILNGRYIYSSSKVLLEVGASDLLPAETDYVTSAAGFACH